ncbi:MAG: hypothetical protein J3R72DRAFT_128956 [Linnemannia gamsii]|nr:MAG: hypothetical protein J3R72DRAFT_128956 [Linnemannia gamsii]
MSSLLFLLSFFLLFLFLLLSLSLLFSTRHSFFFTTPTRTFTLLFTLNYSPSFLISINPFTPQSQFTIPTMDFSGNIIHNQAAADMSSADLFDYLLSNDNDATFSSFYPPNTQLPISHPTVLPAVQQPIAPSFSYRQISPSMPPSNPPTTTSLTHIAIAPAPAPAPAIAIAPARPAAHIKPILPKAAASTASCTATATAVTTSASTLISPALFTSGSSIPSSSTTIPVAVASEDIWKERFQQLQQLQQTHRHKQHQLLSAAIFNSPTTLALTSSPLPTAAAATISSSSSSSRAQKSSSSSSSQRGSSSERSVSPEKSDKLRAIYPSPPMDDDMAMESDSEARFGLGSDFAKPTESQLKLMTSKERRQLRNKLSARNFRVRRKEYIDDLENQVKEAKREAADIQRRLIQSELNCQFLRQELEATRLSQSLFGAGSDGRMSKEHANLLASLLNPNTETFPSVNNIPSVNNTNNPIASVQLTPEQLSSASWMDASLANAAAPAAQSTATSAEGQVPMEPFVPFDGDWSGLLINRAEVSEAIVDPKDASTGPGAVSAASGEARSPAHELLVRYEALKREAEMDAQMRAEIKADTERRLLAQTYMVVPKEDATSDDVRRRLEGESVVLKSLIYMLMVQLTGSLIEAATLSKTDLVRMYQAMDEPLRAKMLAQAKEQDCSTTSRFMEWREGWIKRCSPSFYNNRRRIVELINRTAICDPCHDKDKDCTSNAITKEMSEKEIIEIARKMEEGVRGLKVEVNGQEIQMCRGNFFYRTFVPDRFKCSGVLAWEKLDAEVKERASKMQQQQQQTVRSLSMPMPMPMPAATGIACA